MAPSRHRAYCYTINNWTSSDHFGARLLARYANYSIIGKEIGHECGTPHLQGYVHLPNPVSFEKMKKALPRANIRVANGSDTQNKTYISKDGDFEEFGAPSIGQGTRTDIKTLAESIKTKQFSIDEIMFEFPELYLKYNRGIKDMVQSTYGPRSTQPQVIWLWGLAGVGKTTYATTRHPSHYIKDNTMWWDRYKQEEAIIIDDYDTDSIPYRTLLRLLDKTVFQGQVKGGYVYVNSPFIYITSEYPPSHFWEDNKLAQVLRRCTTVLEIK